MAEGDSEQEPVQQEAAQVDPSGRWTRTNEVLGKGAFKTVYKGFDEQEGLEIAWNQIRMNELVSSKEERERLFAEIRVLKQLKHKNIMTFYDSWLENKGYTVNFITELFTSGTLRQYRKRHKHMDTEVMKRWAWQILCGLVYLHGHTPPIIHRDLKCDNIFINGSEGVVKIGDLGLATMLRARTAPQSVLGTPEFMAPELYDEEYDDRVDVYSFGMCLLELATLEYPYSECRNAAQIYRKVTLGVRPKALSRVPSKELAEFISYCIQPRTERPRSRQILKHPYFDSIRAEKCSIKLSAEALGVSSLSQSELCEYANSAGSGSVSRTSSAAGELHNDNNMLLDAVPEEEDEAEAASTAEDKAGPRSIQVAQQPAAGPGDGSKGAAISAADENGSDDTLREFKVKGRLQEAEDKLNLRLRILQHDRAAKVVEFDFDLASDTAMSVASEMVEEMSLSHSDAERIALAIKDEIWNLTHKLQQGAEHTSTGSGSDDEAAGKKGPPSEGSAKPEAEAGTLSGACSDSVMSVHDAHRDPSSLTQQPAKHLVATQPRAAGSEGRAAASVATSSPPGSLASLGSPPAAELRLSDSSPLLLPLTLSAPAWDAHLASLPPHLESGLAKPASEGLMARLSRTDSANHVHEVEALQQALARNSGSGRILFAPPKEEDRRLPLKKLLENLQEADFSDAIGAARAATMMQRSRPEAGPHHAADCDSVDTQPTMSSPRPAATPAPATALPASQSDPARSLDAALAELPLVASTSGSQSEGPNPFSGAAFNLSRSSPRSEVGSLPNGGHSLDAAGMGLRSKSKADLAEAKQLRRQAAQTSLKNMESKSLEGFDTFGVTRGCKQVPIKNLMGWGRPSQR